MQILTVAHEWFGLSALKIFVLLLFWDQSKASDLSLSVIFPFLCVKKTLTQHGARAKIQIII